MNTVKTLIIVGLSLLASFSFADEKINREEHSKKTVKNSKSSTKTKHAKRMKEKSDCAKMMRDRLKKLNARLARHEKRIYTKKELAENKKREKERKEILKMMQARRKLLESDKIGKLTKAQQRKNRSGLKSLAKSKDNHKTGDELLKENTNKFDGDIDIDPEDDSDEDPELFGKE